MLVVVAIVLIVAVQRQPADRKIFITPLPFTLLSAPQLPLHPLKFHFHMLSSELTGGDLHLPLLTLLR